MNASYFKAMTLNFCALAPFSFATATTSGTPSLSPETDWQMRLLMAPTESQQVAEQRGRVFIYDSLTLGQVDAALDQHFDRIQNMMFVRIHHLPPTGVGPAEVEDDGCE
jgi:hypothetical protein